MNYDRDNVEIVQVATAPNEAIAQMWASALRDEGIRVLIRSGGSGYALGHNLLNEQYIFVREDDVELAREIIEDMDGPDSI